MDLDFRLSIAGGGPIEPAVVDRILAQGSHRSNASREHADPHDPGEGFEDGTNAVPWFDSGHTADASEGRCLFVGAGGIRGQGTKYRVTESQGEVHLLKPGSPYRIDGVERAFGQAQGRTGSNPVAWGAKSRQAD